MNTNLHGIPELASDAQGYIYWREKQIEHFNHPYEQIEDAAFLAMKCRHLEAIGVPVSTKSAVWFWAWFAPMTADHPYKDFLACRMGTWYVHPATNRIAIIGHRHESYMIMSLGESGWQSQEGVMGEWTFEMDQPFRYRWLMREGWVLPEIARNTRELATVHTTLDDMVTWLESQGIVSPF